LSKLKLEDVNRAIKKHLQAENVKIEVVTKDAEGFKQRALSNKASPISYTSLPAKEILEEDKTIENYKLNFNPNKVEVIPVDQVFEK
jgi:zinc protease